jgi:CheY-like chemotaxis protein
MPDVELLVETPCIGSMETDGTLLGQVLRNLLTNALKFTTGGFVRLATHLHSPLEIQIVISDTGVGIAEADREKIFEEFYQVRGPLQNASKGTGLGLPYARRVTEALGGTISMESQLGHGSTFIVSLPVHWRPRLHGKLSPELVECAKRIDLDTVLIVDDDAGFRTIVRGLLQGIASQVYEAADGAEGLEMMRALAPDLVFMDLRMPRMGGADVIAAMASDPPLRDIPVVIVTSAELEAMVDPAVGNAAVLMSKSTLTKETLTSAVQRALTK